MVGQSHIRDNISRFSERFERTLIGEVVISTLVTVIVIVSVTWSAPDSALRRTAFPRLQPVAEASGLDQSWYMFAPDPYRRLETVEVRATTVTGRTRLWTFPHGNVINQFSWYHWHKLKELAVKHPEIRADVSRWAAHQVTTSSDYPLRIEMVLTWRSLRPPGVAHPQLARGSEVLYSGTVSHP